MLGRMNAREQRIAEGFLFTDLYQLTMAQLYFRVGMAETRAQFDHFYRANPNYGDHQAGFCVNAGLGWFLDWMQGARVTDDDLAVLKSLTGRTGARLFGDDFLDWLKVNGSFEALTLRAIPEGRVVHPGVPLTVVEGPLLIAQLLETALLAQLNYQTLIATKAARIKESARGGLILEFGVRRAHDRGANAGARAALIGGADFTSNTGISHVLGFPPKGTHAHSMVQAFVALGLGELAAFRAYAETYPDECLLLVDTVDTLGSGVPNAITVFEELRRKGHEPFGIRLDSGDLAYLSIQAAKMLNDAGFPDASITLSSNLDELVIWQILTQITQEAPAYGIEPEALIARLVYGVGTRLITSAGDTALGGVYKLVAIDKAGTWKPAIKLSDSREKVPNPGGKGVWRVYDALGHATADLLTTPAEMPRAGETLRLHHPSDPARHRTLPPHEVSRVEPLLTTVLDEGRLVGELPDIAQTRELRERDVAALNSGVRRLVNPHIYHVSLSDELWALKQELIRSVTNGDTDGEYPAEYPAK
jgi:nicotinate phosphoribosyltransferase